MTTHHEGGSRADHDNLVRAWELYHIASTRSRMAGEADKIVWMRSVQRTLQLRRWALVCGWIEGGGETLEDWSEHRVQVFLAQIGALHDEPVPNIMEPGRPIWTHNHHWGVCIGPQSIATAGVVMVRWRGEITPGSLVWWNERVGAYNCQKLGVCMSGWKVGPNPAAGVRDAEGNLLIPVQLG